MSITEPRARAAQPLANPLANTLTEANYPLECWYAAARSEEVSRTPHSVWMLDRPVVLFRKEDGGVAALDNRCPHRWAPLSDGKVIGDDIACPYHGFRFDAAGRCTHIPSQTQIPAAAHVHAYPAIEAGTLVWLWMGDPAKADRSQLPDVNWLTDGKQRWVTGALNVKANFRLLRENVLDLTHLPHVHARSIGANDWTVPPRVSVNEAGHVTYMQSFPVGPQPPAYLVPIGASLDKQLSRISWGTTFTPAYHQSGVELNDPAPAPGARDKWTALIAHVLTPVSPREFVYRWFFGWDIDLPEQVLQMMRDNVPKAYEEDRRILEAVQAMVERDPRGMQYPEVIVQADQAAIQFRRVLDSRLARERGL